MADTRVHVFILNGQNQIADFSSDTLTRLLNENPNLIGQTLRFDILQAGGIRKTVGDYVVQGAPTPDPEPDPTPTGVIYDSNIHGKWNNGHERTVNFEESDPDCPTVFVNGGGLQPRASGKPRCMIDGKGACVLQADAGHGRYYGDKNNYEGVSEYDLTFLDDAIDNHTHQVRSRHQEGGAEENRFGGLNFKLSRTDCGVKVELYHGSGSNHINGPEKSLPKPIAVGQKVRVRCTYRDKDSSNVDMKQEVDYKDGKGFVETVKWTVKLPAYAMDKNLYMQRSYFWMRINNPKTGSIKIENHTIKA